MTAKTIAKADEPMRPQDVRDMLANLDLTQEEFAELTGYTKGSVNNWVRGRIDVPPVIALLLTIVGSHNLTADDIRRAAGR